jgi:hypothetical protein
MAASRNVAATIVDISSATSEQTNVIKQTNQTVTYMDEMTQQNAALSAQSAISTNALDQLGELITALRTGGDARRAVRRASMSAVLTIHHPAGRMPTSGPERLQQVAEQVFTITPEKSPTPASTVPSAERNSKKFPERLSAGMLAFWRTRLGLICPPLLDNSSDDFQRNRVKPYPKDVCVNIGHLEPIASVSDPYPRDNPAELVCEFRHGRQGLLWLRPIPASIVSQGCCCRCRRKKGEHSQHLLHVLLLGSGCRCKKPMLRS